MRDLLLGVDIGTSSSKGVLVQPDGTIVATAQGPHELALPRPGWAEHGGEGAARQGGCVRAPGASAIRPGSRRPSRRGWAAGRLPGCR